MRRADLISAAVFVALGLVTIFFAVPRYVARTAADGELSAAFMPYVAASLLTVAMALLLLSRLRAPRTDEDAPALPGRSFAFIGTAIAVLAAAFALMDSFGYLAGAATLVAGFLLIVRARVRVAVGTAVVLPLALWLLFDKLLDFPLP